MIITQLPDWCSCQISKPLLVTACFFTCKWKNVNVNVSFSNIFSFTWNLQTLVTNLQAQNAAPSSQAVIPAAAQRLSGATACRVWQKLPTVTGGSQLTFLNCYFCCIPAASNCSFRAWAVSTVRLCIIVTQDQVFFVCTLQISKKCEKWKGPWHHKRVLRLSPSLHVTETLLSLADHAKVRFGRNMLKREMLECAEPG